MLDYSFYNPESKCPPDEILLEILEKLENGAAAGQILENETRWEMFFHLSALRGNLIAWYPMEAHAEVLEIGAGCGALTSQLCKMASHVDALEACEEKAKINKLINEKADNLSIYVCGLDGFSVNKKYDYMLINNKLYNNLHKIYMHNKRSNQVLRILLIFYL